MTTPAQFANDAKVRIQNEVIQYVRKRGPKMLSSSWIFLTLNKKLWAEIEGYDLAGPQRRAHLNKVAFPEFNHEDVDAALKSGNNLNDLYALARGRATIAKNSAGKYIKGRKGHLKILK